MNFYDCFHHKKVLETSNFMKLWIDDKQTKNMKWLIGLDYN
jgi:hypothetical protein